MEMAFSFFILGFLIGYIIPKLNRWKPIIYMYILRWWKYVIKEGKKLILFKTVEKMNNKIIILNKKENRATYFPSSTSSDFDELALAFTYKLQKSHWLANEIDLKKSTADWRNLSAEVREVYKTIFAFFALGDGVVLAVLDTIEEEVVRPEIKGFYITQCANELVHAQVYGLIVKEIIDNETERQEILECLPKCDPLNAKIQWVNRWCKNRAPFSVKCMLSIIMEQVWFSCAFSLINVLRRFNFLEDIVCINDFVIADETLHRDFGVHILTTYAPLVGERLTIFKTMAEEAYAAELKTIDFVNKMILLTLWSNILMKPSFPQLLMRRVRWNI